MMNFECPLCHSATDTAGKMRFCPKCGWNKKQAAQQLRVSLRILPIGVVAAVVGVLALARSGARQSPSVYLLIVGIPAIVYVFAYVSVKRSLSKLEDLPDVPANSGLQNTGAAGKGSGAMALEPSEKDKALLRTSRPREVQMSARGKKSLGMIAVMVCVFEGVLIWQLHRIWALAHSFERYQRKDWALLGLVVLLVVLPLTIWRTMTRERALLENGELTMGRVVKKWKTREDTIVYYEFTDTRGQIHKRSGADYSRTLEIGMPLAVFYDRDDPNKQVAACSALHEVAM